MSETSDWTRRVDQMTGATVHEQLRTVVRDAEEMLQRFTTSAYEQGGLLLDAQRELEMSVERKIDQVSSDISGSLDAVRKDIASMEEMQKSLETRVDASLRATDERLAKIQSQLESIAGMLHTAPPAAGPTTIAS